MARKKQAQARNTSKQQSQAQEKRKAPDGSSQSGFAVYRKLRDLATHGLKIREVKADGNCFFRAVADQLEVRLFGVEGPLSIPADAQAAHLLMVRRCCRAQPGTTCSCGRGRSASCASTRQTLSRTLRTTRASTDTASAWPRCGVLPTSGLPCARHGTLCCVTQRDHLTLAGERLGRAAGAGGGRPPARRAHPHLPGGAAPVDHQARLPRLPPGVPCGPVRRMLSPAHPLHAPPRQQSCWHVPAAERPVGICRVTRLGQPSGPGW